MRIITQLRYVYFIVILLWFSISCYCGNNPRQLNEETNDIELQPLNDNTESSDIQQKETIYVPFYVSNEYSDNLKEACRNFHDFCQRIKYQTFENNGRQIIKMQLPVGSNDILKLKMLDKKIKKIIYSKSRSDDIEAFQFIMKIVEIVADAEIKIFNRLGYIFDKYIQSPDQKFDQFSGMDQEKIDTVIERMRAEFDPRFSERNDYTSEEIFQQQIYIIPKIGSSLVKHAQRVIYRVKIDLADGGHDLPVDNVGIEFSINSIFHEIFGNMPLSERIDKLGKLNEFIDTWQKKKSKKSRVAMQLAEKGVNGILKAYLAGSSFPRPYKPPHMIKDDKHVIWNMAKSPISMFIIDKDGKLPWKQPEISQILKRPNPFVPLQRMFDFYDSAGKNFERSSEIYRQKRGLVFDMIVHNAAVVPLSLLNTFVLCIPATLLLMIFLGISSFNYENHKKYSETSGSMEMPLFAEFALKIFGSWKALLRNLILFAGVSQMITQVVFVLLRYKDKNRRWANDFLEYHREDIQRNYSDLTDEDATERIL